MTITIVPATADRFDDVEHTFSGGGDGLSCQCQWWTLTNAQFEASDRDERERMLRAQVAAEPSPALIAYVDEEAAGWVRVGPRPTQPRLSRTRNFAATTEPWDDPSVWAVSCFVVRKEHRGRGLNRKLLDAAIDHARTNGARVLEAYPTETDTDTAKRRSNDLYIGILSVFESAGFREIARPKPERVIVQLKL
ncbi:MAG: GNAT family N-acetyltransferase [Microbacterium sp.]|uniref:GNAT family N-acetyltransferase n=1 Tax=Microbacterium sp. TaxID=51671 RepID=UPI00271EACFC|nr:GNAT family N-acetyltransferase [Microbacterium sp.]MDO8381927.1 GNAT family N-acetyltransferase [Microbacterium sp.]